MARKSAAAHIAAFPSPVVIDPVRRGHYADYPACLPNYKWLVEQAMSHPAKMFNSPTVGSRDAHYCKCCGAAYARADFAGHVNEHAHQLKLGKAILTAPASRSDVGYRDDVTQVIKVADVPEELKLTIIDSIQGRLEELGLEFKLNYGLLGDKVAKAISDVTTEGNASEPLLCAECAA